jgi:hypothetical protein
MYGTNGKFGDFRSFRLFPFVPLSLFPPKPRIAGLACPYGPTPTKKGVYSLDRQLPKCRNNPALAHSLPTCRTGDENSSIRGMNLVSKRRCTGMFFQAQRCAFSLVILLAAMLWWMPSDPAQAQDRDQVGREFPQLRIPAPVRGADIVNALGRRLPEVAAFYGKSEEELTIILNQDDSAWIDHEGRLLYICDSDTVPTHSENDDDSGRGRATGCRLWA